MSWSWRDGKPYSKAQQLARGERRYRRKVASPKQWQAIIAAKGSMCRQQWGDAATPAKCYGTIQYHHIVPRDFGGDDLADNIIPLCQRHHDLLTRRKWITVARILAKLTDAEYAYAVGKAGEDWAERIYGLRYSRV